MKDNLYTQIDAYKASLIELNLELKETLHKIRDLQWEMEWKDKKIAELVKEIEDLKLKYASYKKPPKLGGPMHTKIYSSGMASSSLSRE